MCYEKAVRFLQPPLYKYHYLSGRFQYHQFQEWNFSQSFQQLHHQNRNFSQRRQSFHNMQLYAWNNFLRNFHIHPLNLFQLLFLLPQLLRNSIFPIQYRINHDCPVRRVGGNKFVLIYYMFILVELFFALVLRGFFCVRAFRLNIL